MNEPIISPWIFYWMAIAGNIRVVAVVVIFLVGVFYVFSPLIFRWEWQEALPAVKKGVLALCVAGMLLVFVPDRNTIIQMVVASYATPQNIEYITDKTGKAIDGSIDYVIDKIIEAANKWEQRGQSND